MASKQRNLKNMKLLLLWKREMMTRYSQTTSDRWLYRRQSDKLAACREVFHIFTSRSIENCAVWTHVTTDEQLVSFQGRCPFRVYMKWKPGKYGMKIWTSADVESPTSWINSFAWENYVIHQRGTKEEGLLWISLVVWIKATLRKHTTFLQVCC
jgi:hypothetical protein